MNKRVSDTEIDNLTKIISQHCEEVKFISLSSTNKESTICFDLVPHLPWEVVEQSTDSSSKLTVSFKSNAETLAVYPFEFEVKFIY